MSSTRIIRPCPFPSSRVLLSFERERKGPINIVFTKDDLLSYSSNDIKNIMNGSIPCPTCLLVANR